MKEERSVFRCKCGTDTSIPEIIDKINCPVCDRLVRADKK